MQETLRQKSGDKLKENICKCYTNDIIDKT